MRKKENERKREKNAKKIARDRMRRNNNITTVKKAWISAERNQSDGEE